MVAYPQFYDSTDTTLQTAAIAVSQDSGTTYGPQTFHLWNDKGGALGASTLKNCRIVPKVFNGVSRVSSGYPVLDESWVQIALSGQNNVGDSTMQNQTTGFVPVGPNSPLVLKDIPKNCARYLDVKIVVPAGAGNLSQELYLEIIYDEASLPLSLKSGVAIGPGVLPDWTDPSVRRLRRGRTITANGSDTVTIMKGAFCYDGVPYNVLQSTKQLNQTAADGALSVGQSYIGRLSQKSDKTVTLTKGNKGTSPTAPALPAGEIMLGDVTVTYQAGGTSVINTANLDLGGVLYGEFLVSKQGTGVSIGGGTAVTSTDQEPFNGAQSVMSFSNGTWFVWVNPDGSFAKNSSPTVPPTVGAVLLASVIFSGGTVQTVTDKRKWAPRASARDIVLAFYGDAVVATGLGAVVADLGADYYLESVDVVTRVTGSGGSMKIDISSQDPDIGSPATIYTSSGSDDQRPVVPDAKNYVLNAIDHEINQFVAQNPVIFAFDIVSTHTTPATDVFVTLHCRLAN